MSKHLIVYIISLLDTEDQINLSKVNKEWKEMVDLTRKHLEFLPIIHKVPMFLGIGLDRLRIKVLPNGMTNLTLKLADGPDYAKRLTEMNVKPELIKRHRRQEVILRIPGDASFFGVNRSNEQYNALRASALGLNPEIAYFGEDGTQVTKYIPNAQSVDSHLLQRAGLLNKLVAMSKRLHSSTEPFANDIAVFERNDGLYKALENAQFQFPEAVDVIQQKMALLEHLFASYHIKMSCCHNDATPSNYLFVEEKEGEQEQINQIDWEYSGNNDLLWDLAYFSIEAKFSKEQELAYLKAYFGEDAVSESVLAWFTVYKPLVEWWITLWSWTQLVQEATAVDLSEYRKLGAERYERTLAHVSSDEFRAAVSLIENEVDASAEKTLRPF